ncbi:hypothetical protein BST95_09265 [Halioglobus japonicus]|nr:hypothetical protein BST95_09265 [Halioglobus japonicus]
MKVIATTALAVIAWLAFVAYSAFSGLWMNPVVAEEDTRAFFDYAVETIGDTNRGATSLVMIERGAIVHEFHAGPEGDVDRDTVFAAASMSKWLAAYAMMALVADGRADLDAPVGNYLTRWQLPASEFANEAVTIRRLLSHTAGFTDGLGFGDYTADETLPELEDELSNPRASTGEPVQIRVNIEPGTEWNYSGGSYLLLELLVEEVSGQSFEDFVQATVLDPLEMTRSGYRAIDTYTNSAGSLDTDGARQVGFQYASSAATGMVTSSADMAKFVLAHIGSTAASAPLSPEFAKSMRAPLGRSLGFDIWGLGTILYAPTGNGDFIFGHDGANDPAINTAARLNPESGDALVILVSGQSSLATTLGSDWVFWQSGYPDLFATDAVFGSMMVPALSGTAVILAVAVVLGLRTRRKA